MGMVRWGVSGRGKLRVDESEVIRHERRNVKMYRNVLL